MQWQQNKNFKDIFGYTFLISIFWSFFLGFTISGNLLTNFFFLFFVSYATYNIFLDLKEIDIFIKFKHLFILLISAIAFSFFLPSQYESLNTDHWYHFFSAYAPLELALQKIPSHIFIGDVSVNLIFHLYSLFGLFSLFCFYYLYLRHQSIFLFFITFTGILLIFAKFFLGILDIASPHPELRTLPLFILGSFGVTDASFKFVNLLPLMALVIYIYKEHFVNNLLFLLLICFIFLFPVVFFNIAIVEFSIWLFCFNTIMLLEIFKYSDLERGMPSENLKVLLISLVLICLIRQPAIFSFIPLLVYILLYKSYAELKFFTLCLVIPAIQLFHNLLIGNPALPTDIGAYNLIYTSISIDTIMPIFANIGPFLFLALASFFFLNTKANLLLIIFLLSYWIAFHLIDPILWGMPRYLTEYIAPLVILGTIIIMHKYSLLFCAILLPALIFSSVEINNHIDNINAKNTQKWLMEDSKIGIRKYHSQIGSPWKKAVNKIPDELLSKTIFEGFVFKASPLIMSPNVSISDYLSSKELTERFSLKLVDSTNSCEEILYNMGQTTPLKIISHKELDDSEIVFNRRWGTQLWIKEC